MRYGDVQDTRKSENIIEHRKEEFRKSFDWCMEKLSRLHNKGKMVVSFGATFTI